MPLQDDRDLALSTPSGIARDAYCQGVDLLLSARPGAESALQAAIAADPDFALAHVALARSHQTHGRAALARSSIAPALACIGHLPAREASHVRALEAVVMGDAGTALARIQEHLTRWPRDVMVMAPCAGVFGLYGFSGKAGREQALLDFLEPFARELHADWWFLASRAFARCETGMLRLARADIEASLAKAPGSANGAHIHTHVLYESGEHGRARDWLGAWLASYPPEGVLHGHLHWHLALACLALGDTERAWALYRQRIAPGAAWGPPLNLVTDGASFLLRASFLGESVRQEDWLSLVETARQHFPQAGVAFADAHIAIALAMAGQTEGLTKLRAGAKGPAADVVVALADAFEAFGRADFAATFHALEPILPVHERIGGSRAQRDLIEQMARLAITRGALQHRWQPRGLRGASA